MSYFSIVDKLVVRMVDPLSMKVFWSLKLFMSLVGSLFGSFPTSIFIKYWIVKLFLNGFDVWFTCQLCSMSC